MNGLDALVDAVVSDAVVGEGQSLTWLQSNTQQLRPTIAERKTACRQPNWTEAEDQFYRDHLADMSLEEIAAALGRSPNAVKIHRFRAGLPSHRRTPGYLTTCQVARILGVDSHNPPLWVDHGIMPGELVPLENKTMRRISWVRFKMWLTRPESWLYFKLERVKNPSIRRFVELAKARWGDEWWSTKQAAAYHGCDSKDIERQVKLGKIYGFHVRLLGGRNPNPGWAYIYVRKSEAMRLKIYKGKGSNRGHYPWSPRADAFILRAHAEGRQWVEIARMMKWDVKRVAYRAKMLIRMAGVSAETSEAPAFSR